jgi:hypothetical protein
MRARVAAALALVTAAGLLSPSTADAVTPPATPLGPLPASAAGTGGAGTPELAALVSHACNADAPLAGDAWFALPTGDLGLVYARAYGAILSGRSPSYMTSTQLALVDTATSSVTCGSGPISIGGAHPTDLVVWYAADEYTAQADCTGVGACDPPRTDVFVGTTTGAPVNDAMAAAMPVPSLPFTASGDSALATDDGPLFHDECTVAGAVAPASHGTVWWRWTAPADGDLHATITPGFPLAHAGVVDASDPTTALEPARDADGCPLGSFVVSRGRTYLVSVHVFADEQGLRPLQTGGSFTLDLALDRVPEPVSTAFASPSGASGITLRWAPPASAYGASAVTGYDVAITPHGCTDAPTTVTLGAGAREHTFAGLIAGAAYDLTVRAVNARGASAPVVRLFSLADAAQFGESAAPPASVVTRRGVGRATVSWTRPAYEGSSPVTGYRIRTFVASTSRVLRSTFVAASVRTVVVRRLANGVGYRFDVTPINAAGLGRPSARTRVVVPATPPGAPTSVLAWSGVAGGRTSAVVDWTTPRAFGGVPITAYVITAWRFDRAGRLLSSTVLDARPATARRAILLVPHGFYRFSVRAQNAVGVGATTARSNLVVAR